MNFIHLKIYGQNLDLSDISINLNSQPHFTCKKGDRRLLRGEEIVYKEDIWTYTIEVDEADKNTMEQSISQFVSKIYTRRDYFRYLKSQNASMYLVITYYIDNYQTILTLSSDTLKKISSMDLELCMDIMNL